MKKVFVLIIMAITLMGVQIEAGELEDRLVTAMLMSPLPIVYSENMPSYLREYCLELADFMEIPDKEQVCENVILVLLL